MKSVWPEFDSGLDPLRCGAAVSRLAGYHDLSVVVDRDESCKVKTCVITICPAGEIRLDDSLAFFIGGPLFRFIRLSRHGVICIYRGGALAILINGPLHLGGADA